MSYNELTPAEIERLAHLAEEAGEIVLAVGKILRHGYYSKHPDGGPTNKEMLEKEIGDLMGVADLMVTAMDISPAAVDKARILKPERSKKFYHHQPKKFFIKV